MPFWDNFLKRNKKKKTPKSTISVSDIISLEEPVLDIPPALRRGATRDDFEPLAILGKGTFASVVLVRSHYNHHSSGNGGCANKRTAATASFPHPAVVDSTNNNTGDSHNRLLRTNSGSFCSISSEGNNNRYSSASESSVNGVNVEKLYAMKIVEKRKLIDVKRVKDVFTERDVLARASHPFLVKLHYTFQSERKLFFVMDYMPGGDLRSQINSFRHRREPMPYEMVQLYIAEVTLALTHLHEHGILYRDLKPENILLNNVGHCALADFGLSKDFGSLWSSEDDQNGVSEAEKMKKLHSMRTTSFVGSPLYVAPEVLKREKYSTPVDFWGLGVLLYTLLFGAEPFRGHTAKDVFDQILTGNVRYPVTIPTTAEARDLIEQLLNKDATRRMKTPEIFAHQYFRGLDFNTVYKKRITPSSFTLPKDPLVLQQEAQERLQQTGECSDGHGFNEVYTPDPANAPYIHGSQQQLFENFSWVNLEQFLEKCPGYDFEDGREEEDDFDNDEAYEGDGNDFYKLSSDDINDATANHIALRTSFNQLCGHNDDKRSKKRNEETAPSRLLNCNNTPNLNSGRNKEAHNSFDIDDDIFAAVKNKISATAAKIPMEKQTTTATRVPVATIDSNDSDLILSTRGEDNNNKNWMIKTNALLTPPLLPSVYESDILLESSSETINHKKRKDSIHDSFL